MRGRDPSKPGDARPIYDHLGKVLGGELGGVGSCRDWWVSGGNGEVWEGL